MHAVPDTLPALCAACSEEEEVQEPEAAAGKAGTEKKGYVGIHATGFKELMLKPELLQAITDCGFEHPSEGAHAAVDAAVACMVSGQPACRCACKLTMARMRCLLVARSAA